MTIQDFSKASQLSTRKQVYVCQCNFSVLQKIQRFAFTKREDCDGGCTVAVFIIKPKK